MAKVNWSVTEKSQFLVTGGWVDRKNADFVERDFSGFNARGTYTWAATEKLGIAINGWRLTSSMQNLTANFSLNTGVSVNPYWQITQKFRLEGDFPMKQGISTDLVEYLTLICHWVEKIPFAMQL